MTDKAMEKLLKASTLACKENLQYLLIVFTKDVHCTYADKWISKLC